MVKIKVKKEMTLPELIQWGWENKIVNERFCGSLGGCIYFDEDSWIGIDELDLVQHDEFFEVEVEEEITEETKIPVLVEVYKWKEIFYKSALKHNTSVSFEKDETSLAFYMLNDDMTMTLLWKEGEMVE
ncbi:hypothetical protein ACSAXG_04785 [Staphylococcus chromogenes]